MKQALIITALLAPGLASAQSSVTLFGVVDAAINRTKNSTTNPSGSRSDVTRTSLNNSGYNTSRLGFRGIEDLGGGLSAGFWLESALANDDGSGPLSFTRRSTVSLAGQFGEVRLGRDYTPTFNNDSLADPLGTVGLGASILVAAQNLNTSGGSGGFGSTSTYTRSSNAVGYFLPPGLGGVYGQAMYAFDENVQSSATIGGSSPRRTGRYVGGRLGLTNGTFNVATAYGQSNALEDRTAGWADTVKTVSLSGSYDFGVVKIFAGISRLSRERGYSIPALIQTPDLDLNGGVIGFNAPIGVGMFRGSYSRVKYDLNAVSRAEQPKADKVAFSYVHNLSKRTALYGTIARVANYHGAALTAGGPAYGTSTIGLPRAAMAYDLGIRHAF